MKLISDRTPLIHTENAFKLGPHIARAEKARSAVIRCNLGEPDFPLPVHIRDEVKRQLDSDNVHYTDPQGVYSLREAVAGQISNSRNIEVTPERVVVFPGGKPAIGFCQQVYCNPGDEVIYPSPGYPIYESFIRYVGATPVPLFLREELGFSVRGEDLERLITKRTKLIFLNFPSNPTGGVATSGQLRDIADVVLRKCDPNVRVYSDEMYERILFDGAAHLSIASLPGMSDRTIIAGGASKSFSWTGGRIGWAVFPTVEEAKILTNLNINYFSCVPPYNQEGARLALTSDESGPAIRDMVEAFQERRDFAVNGLNSIAGIQCQLPGGAFYVFPNISGVIERLGIDSAYNTLAEGARINTSPSTMFQMFLLFRHFVATMDRRSFGMIGCEGQHYLRLSIATSMDDLKTAMDSLSEAVEDENGFRDYFAKQEPLY